MGLPWLRKKSLLVWGVVVPPSQSQLVMELALADHEKLQGVPARGCLCPILAGNLAALAMSPVSYMTVAARDQV